MELIIFIGIPASGKSTFYKNKFFDSHLRINLDMLKTRNREKIIFEACIKSKQKIVVDNTNPLVEDRKKYIDTAKANDYKIISYYFKTDIKKSLELNKKRDGKKRIPDIAIRGINTKLQIPFKEEGYDEMYYVQMNEEDFLIKEWNEIEIR